jgi:hypothetical protein
MGEETVKVEGRSDKEEAVIKAEGMKRRVAERGSFVPAGARMAEGEAEGAAEEQKAEAKKKCQALNLCL